MIVNALKTEQVTVGSSSLWDIVDRAVPDMVNRSILVITSKIVSICEGRVVRIGEADKQSLIRRESERYIDPEHSAYGISLTITNDMLIPTAGIDESNGNGYYILWPENPYRTASEIRSHLVRKFARTDVGVLITDSKTTPLRWGTTGVSLGHAGFAALHNYIDTPDIFGRQLKVTKANVADGLAAAAVTVMGEGNEQTPLAIITDVPFVQFEDTSPTAEDIRHLVIDPADDLYAPLIDNAPWEKGSAKK